MDYNPTNIVPKGWKQGDYYTTTIGPYDIWAIEYGYKPLSGGTTGELSRAEEDRLRSGEPALPMPPTKTPAASTPIPTATASTWAPTRWSMPRCGCRLVKELIPGLVERMTRKATTTRRPAGRSTCCSRSTAKAVYFVSRYVGGLQTSRSHKGDKDGKAARSPSSMPRCSAKR